MRRALFFDVDGTLVDMAAGIDRVPDAVVAELRRVQRAGHVIFVCSGRPWPMIDDHLRTLGFDGFVLANGGDVRAGATSIRIQHMGADLARLSEEILRDEGVEHVLDTAGHVFLDASFQTLPPFIRGCATTLPRNAFPTDVHERTIKLECFPTLEVRHRLRERLASELGDAVVADDNGIGASFELYSPSLSKATGIGCALAHLGIDPARAIAFGDGTNDLPAFEVCGTAVAMGGASERVRAAADVVCGRVEEDGLARALRELV